MTGKYTRKVKTQFKKIFMSKKAPGLVAIIILAVICSIFLVASKAATSVANFEAENSSVTGSAVVKTAADASAGSFIEFTNTANPTVVYGPQPKTAPTTAYVTPEQHGARGNGTADDTVAMQNALDASAGKTLWIPTSKTYRISKTISISSNTTIVGAGKTSVIKFTWQDASGANSGGGTHMRTKGTSSNNIHLSNFVIEGGGDGLPAGDAASSPNGNSPTLKFISLSNFSVKNMEIRNSPGLSISHDGSQHGIFQYNYVHHSGRDGITGYWGDLSRNLFDIIVDSNLIEKVGDDGIAINGLMASAVVPYPGPGDPFPLPYNVQITNNIIIGWNSEDTKNWTAAQKEKIIGRGIQMNGVKDVTVKNNTITNPPGTGILAFGCYVKFCTSDEYDWHNYELTITDNKISGALGGSRPGAIHTNKTDDSTITNNTATNSSPYDFSGCTRCTLTGNSQTSVQ